MPSLLLIIFILQLTIHLINTVGATAIDELVLCPPPKLLPNAYQPSAPHKKPAHELLPPSSNPSIYESSPLQFPTTNG